MKNKKKLLDDIRKLKFATVDLNLYLDNFPDNQKALCAYNDYTNQLILLKKEYEKRYGILTNFGTSASDYPWSFINEPWPWESGE
ncbi:spore coat protein JB [Clostridium algifaecis]|uniref:Spore coat protein JB n=1 Tax=Clostridium algifaecis TaxID=1472040 RepID=A0ABS4KQB0_9CLOT|nr:spore coat protein CotJB [Clostridium algifaecis]MBP2032237.1 spore coat protein JB [Clostridium algifaecis]